MGRKNYPVAVASALVLLIGLALGSRAGAAPGDVAELAIAGPGAAAEASPTPQVVIVPTDLPADVTPSADTTFATQPAATQPAVVTPDAAAAPPTTSPPGTTAGSTTRCTGSARATAAPDVAGLSITPAASEPDSGALSLALRVLNRVNCYRALEGVPPLTLDPALNQAAAAHVNYYLLNNGASTMAGMGLHDETRGNAGFTGVEPDDRAKAAGATDWYVDENIGLGGSPESDVDWFVNSVNHRENLLHPSAVHLGFASSANPPIEVFDIGVSDAPPTVALPSVYPANGQTDVPVSVDLEEAPDPAPGVPRPLGYPLTISFGTQDKVTFSGYRLTDSTGQSLQVFSAEKKWLRTLALIPARPLSPGQTYTVEVDGTRNGQPFTQTWSFTTAA